VDWNRVDRVAEDVLAIVFLARHRLNEQEKLSVGVPRLVGAGDEGTGRSTEKVPRVLPMASSAVRREQGCRAPTSTGGVGKRLNGRRPGNPGMASLLTAQSFTRCVVGLAAKTRVEPVGIWAPGGTFAATALKRPVRTTRYSGAPLA
jgi:hypothetical protein